LLKTMHSKRGTLTTKIKDIVFAVFGDSMLDWIDSNAIPDEVHNWKQSAKTKAADFKLFSPIVANDPEDTYISHILTNDFSRGCGRKLDGFWNWYTEDQAAVSETASVPEISNVLSEGAPKTTQVQEETEKSRTCTPEKRSALKSSE
ncbi:22003_t:CDS:2, partial [Gigaspora rosea]